MPSDALMKRQQNCSKRLLRTLTAVARVVGAEIWTVNAAAQYQNPLIGSANDQDGQQQDGGSEYSGASTQFRKVYYAYATGQAEAGIQNPSAPNADGIRMSKTADFQSWTGIVNVLQRPAWVDPDKPGYSAPSVIWNPDQTDTSKKVVMYYNAWQQGTGDACIGVAVAPSPDGPFTDTGVTLRCSIMAEAVDAAPFLRADGNWYLNWGSDGPIHIKPLRPSDITKWTQPNDDSDECIYDPITKAVTFPERLSWKFEQESEFSRSLVRHLARRL